MAVEGGGQPIRGYRPSRFGLMDMEPEEEERIRSANVEVYARRVRAGLPVFDEPGARPAFRTLVK